MKHFLDDDFLLHTVTAEHLYHNYAKCLPIIDYHCHLPSQQIARNINFKNITRAWLYNDQKDGMTKQLNALSNMVS